jgi:uncharacterized protein YbjQ (UPF0145 family)
MHKSTHLLAAILVAVLSTGCAAYRTDSNITSDATPSTATASNKTVIIAEDALPGRRYTTIGPIEVTVKKLTAFHSDPTKEQAKEVLIEKARIIDADAVVNVKYESGIGMMTWGYIEAKGAAVKFVADGTVEKSAQ